MDSKVEIIYLNENKEWEIILKDLFLNQQFSSINDSEQLQEWKSLSNVIVIIDEPMLDKYQLSIDLLQSRYSFVKQFIELKTKSNLVDPLDFKEIVKTFIQKDMD